MRECDNSKTHISSNFLFSIRLLIITFGFTPFHEPEIPKVRSKILISPLNKVE